MTVREAADLFVMFVKVGAFTLGGGYAMVPLIEREVVRNRRWMTNEEFVDMMAIAQSMPGMLALNAASYVGYRRGRFWGALAAGAGVVFPAFAIMLVVAMFFHGYQDNPTVIRIFSGIRPAVAALVAAAVWDLGRKAKLRGLWLVVAAGAALWAWLAPVSPTWLVGLAVLAGACFLGNKQPDPVAAASADPESPLPEKPDDGNAS